MDNNTKNNKRDKSAIISAVQKMVDNKKAINKHLDNGGTLADLAKQGIRFAKPL